MNSNPQLSAESDWSDSEVGSGEDSVRISPSSKGSPSKLRRVLVVEDSDSDAMLLSHYLTRANDGVEYVLERAETLASGIQLLNSQKFHIALVDLGLPDSWGLGTLDQLLAQSPEFPLIVLTGLDDESVGVEAVKRGAADFLPKGRIDTDMLVRTVSHARVRHKIQKQLARALDDAQANEANLHNLISSHADGMVVVSQSQAIVFANQSASKIYGTSLAEMGGMSFGLPIQVGQKTEGEVLQPDGTTTPVEMRIVDVEWQGQPAYLAMMHDLTARRRAQAERAQLRKTEESLHEAEREIEIARQVQESLFPDKIPSVAGLDFGGAAFPAERACGDYYDFIQLPNGKVGVVIGDVSGHGLGPAMMMVQTRAALRTVLMSPDADLGEALTRVNDLLTQAETGRFVSMFFGVIDPVDFTLRYVSAGHQGYLLRGDGSTEFLEPTGPVLGVIAGQSFESADELELSDGDMLLLPTDGIEEAHSPDQKMFGRDRMFNVARASADSSAMEIVHSLRQAACDFTDGPQVDDITVVVVKVEK